jgi:hypothetical protein
MKRLLIFVCTLLLPTSSDAIAQRISPERLTAIRADLEGQIDGMKKHCV